MCIFCPSFSVQESERASGRATFSTCKETEDAMKELNPREYELVALGAAIASNCVPCIDYHIPEARKAGLSDAQILEAIQLADKIKQVPARKVVDAAKALLKPDAPVCQDPACGCTAGEPASAPASCC